ncbi:hypothetical protein SAMN02745704_01059 [Paucidesulfovibrio gracilis DSM 16080]|uniref:Uncharacterized protein n=1 Tax=Paucidesulfovibrio gracilis DSM 16080 TaxID=1121449 RepID=A0A1T4WL61_9BACT|nr:hypothetical protein [Paucidesulfovibrio gracilis]SKA77887.1 hypothetical protein SAMN02745704_01059 [Paucidesulfovibrio gracilis DSM 16080]
MDENVLKTLTMAFAADVYESVDAARKDRDLKVFRHTMFEGEDGLQVFCGFFPKADLQAIPGLTEEFLSQLKTFNMVGVITDGKRAMELFHVGAQNKPFQGLEKAEDLAKVLDRDRLMIFLQSYFDVRGITIDLETVSYEDFLKVVEEQVFQFTTMKEMQIVDQFLGEN